MSFHARDAASPSADEVIGQMIDGVYTNATATTAYERGVRRQARRAVVDALFALAADQKSTADVQAVANDRLNRLATTLVGREDDRYGGSRGERGSRSQRAELAGSPHRAAASDGSDPAAAGNTDRRLKKTGVRVHFSVCCTSRCKLKSAL